MNVIDLLSRYEILIFKDENSKNTNYSKFKGKWSHTHEGDDDPLNLKIY